MPRNILPIAGMTLSVIGIIVVMGLLGMPTPPADEALPADMLPTEGNNVAQWIVSGAGTTNYDGTYVQDGTYGGQPAYKLGDGYWLWWKSDIPYPGWKLSPAVGDVEAAWAYAGLLSTALPANPWEVCSAASPAPTLSEGPGIRMCATEALAAKWDDETKHKYSKYGYVGGGRDVDAAGPIDTNELQAHVTALSTPFDTGDYQIRVKLDTHIWSTTNMPGQTSGTEWDVLIGNNALPFAKDTDWETWLGSAGAKTLTLELYDVAGEEVLASDTYAYTMFIPTPEFSLPAASANVPDRFEVTVDTSECYSPTTIKYDLYAVDGAGEHLLRTIESDVTYEASEWVDLLYADVVVGEGGWETSVIELGAFALRARLNDIHFTPTVTPPSADRSLTYIEQYEISQEYPEEGASCNAGEWLVRADVLQRWVAGQLVTWYAWVSTAYEYVASNSLSTGIFEPARPRRATGLLPDGATKIKVTLSEYDSGWVVVASDEINVTVRDQDPWVPPPDPPPDPPPAEPEEPDPEPPDPGGTDPPTVSITAPADEATVDGTVAVSLSATDDTGVQTVVLKVDGAIVESWDLVPIASWSDSHDLDSLDYTDGSHTITASATDENGNTVTDTITVHVANNAALAQALWVSCKFSDDPILGPQLTAMISAGRKASSVLMSAVITPEAAPENNYGLRFGLCSGGAWTNFDDCQTLIPEVVQAVVTPFEDARAAIEFTPLVAWDNVAMTASEVIDHQVVSDSLVLLLAAGAPAAIYSWNGEDAVASWLSLSGTWAAGYTPVGFRVLGSKCYIAAMTDDTNPQPAVLVQELDSVGEPTSADPYAIEMSSRYPHVITDICLASSYVIVGTDDSAGNGDIWRIDEDEVTYLTGSIPGVRCLWPSDSGDVFVGAANGSIYYGTTLDHATGEAQVNAGLEYGSSQFALTGSGGKVFRRTGGTWALLATATALTQPAACAIYNNRLWVGGNGPELYAYDFATAVWQQYATMTGWTAITDLVAFAGTLLVFGAAAGSIFRSLAITNAHIIGRYVDEVALQIVDTEVATS